MIKITANEARILAITPAEEALEYAYRSIRAAATEGHTTVNLRNEFFCRGQYNPTARAYSEVSSALRKEGFNVKYVYDMRNHEDRHTNIRW